MSTDLVETSRAQELVARGRAALAEARGLSEIRTVREWAKLAANAAAAARKLSDTQLTRADALAAELDAHELRVEAMYVEGTLLREMRENKQRAGSGNPQLQQAGAVGPTRHELGYEYTVEISRALQVSDIPEPVMLEYFATSRERFERASVAGLLRMAADAGRRAPGATPPLPAGVFRTLVVDPPWPMSKSGRVETPEQGSTLDYPTLTLEQIAELPLASKAADASHLYLWVTQRFLPDALRLVAEWGFTYHCLLTWVKPGGFAPFSWMFNAEHAIFAYRGRFELRELGVKIAFPAPATGHSAKPEAFYELVERVSFEPRIDCFARKQRAGWTAWGDEAS